MKVRGTFQRAEEANSNNRIYPKSVLESQITKLQPLITERRLCGELDHPQSDTVRLSNASHLVTKLWMKDNEVFGEAEVLNTPAGKVAQALISDGVKIGISSRGLGTLSEGVYGKTKTVNDDFRLVTFDLVADPSTRGAYPSLSESVMYTNEKYKRTLDQALSEKVFLTVLKNKLSETRIASGWTALSPMSTGSSPDKRWNPFKKKTKKKLDEVIVSLLRQSINEKETEEEEEARLQQDTVAGGPGEGKPRLGYSATRALKRQATRALKRPKKKRLNMSTTILRLLRDRMDELDVAAAAQRVSMAERPKGSKKTRKGFETQRKKVIGKLMTRSEKEGGKVRRVSDSPPPKSPPTEPDVEDETVASRRAQHRRGPESRT